MTITASVFAARYKLACFFISNHLFETVISVDPGLDISDLAKLQRDQGFFMSSLRLVEQLTAFKSESEMEALKLKIQATGTMYFRKSILTAVVKQGAAPATEEETAVKKQENLYDKFVVKRLYDSYFSAYVDDTEPLEFLDKVNPKQETADLVSIFELGVFDSDTLRTISNILDFESKDGPNEAIALLQANPRYATYKHFFSLVSKCF